MRAENMSEKLIAHRRSLGNRKSMDQQTFNEVCGGHIKYLSPRYNCMPYRYIKEQIPQYYTMDEFNELYGTSYKDWKEAVKDAAVIHYITGNKPWLYNDVASGKEWYEYYLKSPYGDKPLDRKGKLHRFKTIKAKEGMSGVLEHYIKGPLRNVYYSTRSLEFRKSKWVYSNWG
jgi:lipopolysaccharide biosynthesis glycosyltransferase